MDQRFADTARSRSTARASHQHDLPSQQAEPGAVDIFTGSSQIVQLTFRAGDRHFAGRDVVNEAQSFCAPPVASTVSQHFAEGGHVMIA